MIQKSASKQYLNIFNKEHWDLYMTRINCLMLLENPEELVTYCVELIV